MANRTAKDAKSIKGTNPQYLVEKIIRTRIYDCKFWKEDCFGLTSELLVDRAMELDHVGGVYGGNVKPTPFICLILKMLQIQPSKDIVIEFIKNPDYKYVRALGAMYLRLVGDSLECFKYLELLYNDYRKLKRKNRNGDFELLHVDEFVDELLHSDRVCDIILPRLQKRHILEQMEQLEPRVSALEEDLSEEGESEEEEEEEEEEERSPPPPLRRRSPSPHRDHHDRDRDRHRHRSRSRSPHRRRSRSPRGRSPRDRRRRSHSRSPRRHRHRSSSYSPHRHDSHRHRKRSRTRSRSPSPHQHHRRQSERDRGGGREEKERDKGSRSSKSEQKEKKSRSSSSKKLSSQEEEIRQANELRAKLGMKPLRVD